MMNDQAIERTWGLRTCGKGKDLVYGLSFKSGTKKNPGTGSSLQMLKKCVWGHEFIFGEWIHSATLPRNEKWHLADLPPECSGPVPSSLHECSRLPTRSPSFSLGPNILFFHCFTVSFPNHTSRCLPPALYFNRTLQPLSSVHWTLMVCPLQAPEAMWLWPCSHKHTCWHRARWPAGPPLPSLGFLCLPGSLSLSLNSGNRLSYSSCVTPSCHQLSLGSLLNFPVS